MGVPSNGLYGTDEGYIGVIGVRFWVIMENHVERNIDSEKDTGAL